MIESRRIKVHSQNEYTIVSRFLKVAEVEYLCLVSNLDHQTFVFSSDEPFYKLLSYHAEMVKNFNL